MKTEAKLKLKIISKIKLMTVLGSLLFKCNLLQLHANDSKK